MEKTFTHGGYSTLKGVKEARAANSADRVKVLIANGHTDIFLEELPEPMTKNQIRERYGFPLVGEKKPKAEKKVEAVTDTVENTADTTDEGEDTVKWLGKGEQPSHTITYATFEEALAAVPTREKGRFLSKEQREERARELMLPAVA